MTMDTVQKGPRTCVHVFIPVIQRMFPQPNKSRECGGLEGTALISGSFEVLIGEQPQKAELISNLEL